MSYKRLVITALLATSHFFGGCNFDGKKGIKEDIGLTELSDFVERSGIDIHREIIYANPKNDPRLFETVVKSVEGSSTIKANKCLRSDGRILTGVSLKPNGFEPKSIQKSVIFKSSDGGFNCVVSEGDGFILVMLYTT